MQKKTDDKFKVNFYSCKVSICEEHPVDFRQHVLQKVKYFFFFPNFIFDTTKEKILVSLLLVMTLSSVSLSAL